MISRTAASSRCCALETSSASAISVRSGAVAALAPLISSPCSVRLAQYNGSRSRMLRDLASIASGRRDDQRAGHARMELAVERHRTCSPDCHCCRALGWQVDVEALVARRCRMPQDVVVLPDDGVARMQCRRNRSELHLLEDDRVLRGGGADAAGGHESRRQNRNPEDAHRHAHLNAAATISACFWCSVKSVKPCCSSALRSAFCAAGMSVVLSASLTVLWKATSLSMYALSNAAPSSLASSASLSAAALFSAWLVGLSSGVTLSFLTSASAWSFTALWSSSICLANATMSAFLLFWIACSAAVISICPAV